MLVWYDTFIQKQNKRRRLKNSSFFTFEMNSELQ